MVHWKNKYIHTIKNNQRIGKHLHILHLIIIQDYYVMKEWSFMIKNTWAS